MRLFACIMDSDADIAVVWVNDVNCAICEAIWVSDCGLVGSWFSICATSNCKKFCWVSVCCAPLLMVSGEVPPLFSPYVFEIDVVVAILCSLAGLGPKLPSCSRFCGSGLSHTSNRWRGTCSHGLSQ